MLEHKKKGEIMRFQNEYIVTKDGVGMCSGNVDNCSNNPHIGEGHCGYRRKDGSCASNFAREEDRERFKKEKGESS